MKSLTNAVASRLHNVRKAKGMTLQQVADGAKTTLGQIHKLERSQRPLTMEWIERLAVALNVSPAELMVERPATTVFEIPLVGRIAAGNWREAVEVTIRHVQVAGVSHDSFALEPEGDSMNVILPDGGYVVINPNDADLREGKIYAVMNSEGETTLKRYRSNPARLEPCSTNPDHQPINLGRENFSVIGRATKAIKDL
ncbi:helix-turn-helix domain-containing protein [Rhizorhabdus wittichii]|uniref:Helix-turn-helix domain-containing protein n=1 Tax=Rhizorhabdus wittichii TaxID=160791 RepID=A0A975HE18_9SPHN|nr:S24 family peptidase [Rhizorhabdus wittichii]QTH21975.1 helix-turn-helix domain-containing protein [Rhizorhabdus wittichii]